VGRAVLQSMSNSDSERPPLLLMECRMIDRWGLMGRARIKVEPDSVDCEFPSRFGISSGTRPISHRSLEIVVFQARIPVFFMRTTVRLIGEDGRVFYIWPFLKLRPLLDVLQQAGFALHCRKTWFSAAAPPWTPRD
jgi:hypothetical protein